MNHENEEMLKDKSGPFSECVDPPQILSDKIDRIREELLNAFEGKIKYDEHKNGVIDKLHAELQTHKDDAILTAISPVVREIIRMADGINRLIRNERQEGISTDTTQKLFSFLKNTEEDIYILLERQGVESFQEIGESFEPGRQKAIETVTTEDPEKHGCISARLRKGYRYKDRILRPELVTVYVYNQVEMKNG